MTAYPPFFDEEVPLTAEAAPEPVEIPPAADPGVPASTAAVEKFKSCRWRRQAEDGVPNCCGHRDVLPMTGTHGFDPAAWCLECQLYKLRRTPKKREELPDRYSY